MSQSFMTAMEAKKALVFEYKNYKGETAIRKVYPEDIWFGSNDYHTKPQWLMTAWDLEKKAWRDFAIEDIIRVIPDNTDTTE